MINETNKTAISEQDAHNKDQSPRPTWRKPTLTRIELKRTLVSVGSGFDGDGFTNSPG